MKHDSEDEIVLARIKFSIFVVTVSTWVAVLYAIITGK